MAKKKIKEEEIVSSNPKLTPALYWEWRCCINEMDLAKKESDVGYLKLESMGKDLEIARLKAAMFKQTLSDIGSKVTLTKEEYEKMKSRIEKELNISLDGCAIDDVTFEIRKL